MEGDAVMAQLTGTLSDGDKVIVSDVPMVIEPNASPSGVMGWEGEFVIPQGVIAPNPGRFLQLKTSDGRSGDIVVESVQSSSDRAPRVKFQTSGSFA
jgi:hypothetical protein